MTKFICLAVALAASLLPFSASADDQNWQDGQYTGDVLQLFAGQSQAVISFVQAHDDLASKAQVFLSECPDVESQGLCALNQTRFILDYIAAFYGDHDSQQNIGYALAGEGISQSGNMQVGVASEPVWGCAWRIATLTSGEPGINGSDLQGYKDDCESLAQDDQDQANALAVSSLLPKINAFSATGHFPFALVDDYPGSQ